MYISNMASIHMFGECSIVYMCKTEYSVCKFSYLLTHAGIGFLSNFNTKASLKQLQFLANKL